MGTLNNRFHAFPFTITLVFLFTIIHVFIFTISNRTEYYVKFSCPFVQERLFKYFSNDLFSNMGELYEPFENLADFITETDINIKKLVKRYQIYLTKNRDWLLKDAPRRSDLRIYEAVFHFNLYSYLHEFLKDKDGKVYPEFPTGNGKIDIIIKYRSRTYGLELKSYRDRKSYNKALKQAALYGKQLGLEEITLILFVEYIDEENRRTLEIDHMDTNARVKIKPVFIETGNP